MLGLTWPANLTNWDGSLRRPNWFKGLNKKPAGLPKAEQNFPEWQAATEALIMAAEGRWPLMHARVGVLRALNRNVERVFNPDRKDHHWGKRKLKIDQ
jgi:hypothetical protein